MELDITFSDKIPWMDSKLTSIKLIPSICHGEESQDAPIEVQGSDEGEILVETGRKVQGFVPDFIITGNGDAFIFSYLYSKAQKHQVSFDLNGDPDAKPRISHSTHSEGSTRFSYGRIKYVPRRSASIGGYTLTAKTHSSMTSTDSRDSSKLQESLGFAKELRTVLGTNTNSSLEKEGGGNKNRVWFGIRSSDKDIIRNSRAGQGQFFTFRTGLKIEEPIATALGLVRKVSCLSLDQISLPSQN